MKNNNYLIFCSKILLLSFILANNFYFSQNVPDNTRLFQLNPLKGSSLSLVETTNSYVYHVGIANSSEVGFDNINYKNIGFDDMFIVKTNITTGINSWVKVFNAGNKGIISPKYVYVDSYENIFIVGQFSGTITAGSKVVTSTSPSDAFIMKIESSGNPLWVNVLTNVNIASNKIKIDSDISDVFMVFNKNSIIRINNISGDIIFGTTYDYLDLDSVALYNNEVYISGMVRNSYVIAGTETFSNMLNSGFVLKGDKLCNFNASLKFKTIDSGTLGNYVDDIDFTSTGKLIISGFSSTKANLETETSTVAYTYTPNTTFPNGVYHFSALVDSNLSKVNYYRISSKLSNKDIYLTRSDIYFNSKIIPYGNKDDYKNLLYISALGISSSFTNSNSSITNTTFVSGINFFNLLLSQDSSGNTTGTNQPFFGGFRISANGNYHTETSTNIRLFTTSTLLTNTSSVLWSKVKSSGIGGSVSRKFVKHLNSAKGDLYFTSLVEGKVNFFGKEVNNLAGLYSRYITRLGENGLPKWFARFHQDSGAEELNISQDFACVDKDDNFLFLVNTIGSSSTFYDSVGNIIDFQQSSNVSSKVLIKLDKDGRLLWSKQVTPTSSTQLEGSVITDKLGDVYLIIANPPGATGTSVVIDGKTLGNSNTASTFLIKLNGQTGSVIYSKNYNYQSFSFIPVFDAQNNLYIFSEPGIGSINSNYIFDNIVIPRANNGDHLMLKFNSSDGAVTWGKNFYQNSTTTSSYSWPNHVVFDGNNFIINGSLNSSNSNSTYFLGLDGLQLNKAYSTSTSEPFIAKVDTNGNPIWQKPLHTNVSNPNGNIANIDIDSKGNIYSYFYFKDKLNINGVEMVLDPIKGNKIFTKYDSGGNPIYMKIVDYNLNYYSYIDVIDEDLVNVSNFTREPNILNYALNSSNSTSLYVATFGKINLSYLSAQKNYLELNNINIDNNPNNANSFSFDLVNNVDWSANSDQSWLNLSFINLTSKKPSATISGNGDAKITLTADTNNTGLQRTANVLISGTGVSSKTIIVTQTGVLGTSESKTFVMMLYPNPTSDVLNIQSQMKITKAEIYDFSGKLILKSNATDKKVNVNSLEKGTYLIKLYTENGIVNSKFIKN